MIIPAGFCQITHNFGGNGLAFPAAVVYGVDQGGGATPDGVAESAHNGWGAEIMPLLNDDVQLESTVAKFGPNDVGPSAVEVGTVLGGNSAAGASSQVAYLVRKVTALGGHRGRGRMYLPGVTESVIGSDGNVDGVFGALLQTALSDFFGTMGFVGLPLVLLHGDATAPTAITSLQLDANVATQRRRLRR